MSTAHTSTLANLRGRIERIETHGDAHDLNKVALGHAAADADAVRRACGSRGA